MAKSKKSNKSKSPFTAEQLQILEGLQQVSKKHAEQEEILSKFRYVRQEAEKALGQAQTAEESQRAVLNSLSEEWGKLEEQARESIPFLNDL